MLSIVILLLIGTPLNSFLEISDEGLFEYEARVISPSSIDPATNLLPNLNHIVVIPAEESWRNQLFVWLPGTEHVLSNNTYILRIAAFAGFRTIGLAYPNALHYGDAGLQGDAQGVENFRIEKIYGTNVSDVINVNRANCIEYRLISLLKWLDSEYPEEGWGAYLNEDGIVWGDVVLAGFSQGASTVGVISRDNAVARAVLIGSGGAYTLVDQDNQTIELSPFEDIDRETPADRTYGILHLQDDYERKSFTFRELGLDAFGDFARADEGSPPHGGTHILSTDHVPRNTGTAYHNSMASDRFMPLNESGIPLLAEDYYYLFTSGL